MLKIEENIREIIRERLNVGQFPSLKEIATVLNSSERTELRSMSEVNELERVYRFHARLGMLDQFISGETFQELILRPDGSALTIFFDGRREVLPGFISTTWINLIFPILAHESGKEWNPQHPFISFDYRKNDVDMRVSLIHKSLSPDGHVAVIRKKNKKEVISWNIDEELFSFLKESVMRKSNILIAGATGSGKTTFLEYLTCFFNEYENIAIIEDTRELAVSSCRPIHLVARQRGPELAEMLPYILRMTPDRIILGEMRSKEITPFILSMTSGHKGLMSTIHANDAAHSIERAALLFELYHPGTNIKTNVIHKLLAQNIDYIIYMKNKKIVEVVAPLNSENGNLAFRRVYSEGPSEGYASAMQFHH